MSDDWKQTACILCECNCGVEVQLGGDNGRHIVRTRGDEAHPASRGYLCQKASRLDHYQNGPDRITQPLRRRDDGSFEAIDWDTAIREVAARFAALRERHSGASIFYYGGGGQGNHLPGAYAAATRRALGSRYRSNALAQEKTGEFWVNGRLFGNGVRADFEHCEVAVFLGKNPWQSHGIPRARITLREIARDPARTLIVIDPVRTETAELADIHLQPRPGTDAWLLHAMLGVLWQEGLTDAGWIAARTTGIESLAERLAAIPVATACAACGIAEEQVRLATRRIAAAGSVACFEDLGVQMNRHSTLVSYLEKLLWLLTGNFAKRGAQYIPAAIQSLFGSGASSQRSPVAGAPIISGLVPCNVIAEEILSDHPDRYRGMLIESANPAHSLAESARFREALRALDTVVVIDVAMTETARLAHYVLPAATQYEKWEATFFNFEFPRNYFHLRRPLFDAPAGALPEAEIHARLVEALGAHARGRGGGSACRGGARTRQLPRRLLRDAAASARTGRHRARVAVSHVGPNPARRRGGRGGALGPAADVRAARSRRTRARGLCRERCRRALVRCDSRGSFRRRVRRGRFRCLLDAAGNERRAHPPGAAGAVRGLGLAGKPAGSARPALSVRALRRRAPRLHRQHDLSRPGLAPQGA